MERKQHRPGLNSCRKFHFYDYNYYTKCAEVGSWWLHFSKSFYAKQELRFSMLITHTLHALQLAAEAAIFINIDDVFGFIFKGDECTLKSGFLQDL